MLKNRLKEKPANENLLVYLAQVEAAGGNEKEAFRIFQKFDRQPLITWRRHEYPYQKDYLKARIYALLGKKEQALSSLKDALQNGQLNHEYDFGRDIFLRSLFDEPAFREMIRPVESSEAL